MYGNMYNTIRKLDVRQRTTDSAAHKSISSSIVAAIDADRKGKVVPADQINNANHEALHLWLRISNVPTIEVGNSPEPRVDCRAGSHHWNVRVMGVIL